MITASEFLKWCEVFHVATGGNPPTDVTLQVAYNNSSTPKQIDISADNLSFLNGTLGVGVTSYNTHSLFQVDSSTAGSLPYPRMNGADEADLESTLSISDLGLSVYNTDLKTLDIFNGTEFQNLLTVQNVLSGTNITVDNNLDGTITINSSGGGGGDASGQTNYFILSNATNTTFSGTSVPTPILSSTLSVLNETNFNTSLVSGTPTSNFLTAATRHCLINACFTLRTSSVLTQTYTVYLHIAGSPASTTGPISSITVNPTGAPGPQLISLTYNLALTGPSQSVQFWISNDSATTDPVLVLNGAVTILDTTQFGGLNSTDNLSQGTNNIYLSQDGGTTYQNLSGTATAGNYAVFNSTGGQLIDLGLAVGDANKINTTQSTSNASFFPLFVASSSNGYQIVNLSPNHLSFVPSTGILSSLGFVGNSLTSISGTDLTLTSQLPASDVNANNININASNGNAVVTSNGGSVNINGGSGAGTSGGSGGGITLTGGDGTHGSTAGAITLTGGTSTTTGGSTSISGGNGSGSSSNGGSLSLSGGSCPGLGGGGNVSLFGGPAGSSGFGGGVTITGGSSGTSSTAGNVRIRGGLATSGTQGSVIFDQGSVNLSLLTASTGLALDASKNIVSLGAGTTTTVLHGNASGLPTYGAVDLTTDVSGTLPFANGGFGFETATTGDIFYASATNTPGKLSDVATGSVLVSGGVGVAPAWSTSPTLTGATFSSAPNVSFGTASANVLTITSSSGAANRADLVLNRNDSTNGNCRVLYQTATSSSWSVGMRSGGSNYTIFDEANTLAQITVAAGPGVTGISTFAGSIIVNNTLNVSSTATLSASSNSALLFGTNGGGISAKNSSGGQEVFCFPRFTDNRTYMDIGSAGATFRQNSAGATWMSVDTSSNVTLSSGNLLIGNATKGIQLKSVAVSAGAANALMVTGCVLVGGTVTITDTSVTTNHRGIPMLQTSGGTLGAWSVTCGSGTFTINSTSATDTSTLSVLFVLPN